MGDKSSFEDAVTTGMHALADEITRSIGTAFGGGLLRWLGRVLGLAPRSPIGPPSAS